MTNLKEIQLIADKYNMIVEDNHQGSFQTYYKSNDIQDLQEVDRSDLPEEIEDFLLKIESEQEPDDDYMYESKTLDEQHKENFNQFKK